MAFRKMTPAPARVAQTEPINPFLNNPRQNRLIWLTYSRVFGDLVVKCMLRDRMWPVCAVCFKAAPRALGATRTLRAAFVAVHVSLFSSKNMILQFLTLLLAHDTLSTSGRFPKTVPNILPMNQLLNATLIKGEARLFYLLDPEPEPHPLSVSVTPCSAAVQWSMLHRKDPGHINATEIFIMAEERVAESYRGADMHTLRVSSASPGLYLVVILAYDGTTAVQIFASMDPGGPHDLVHLQNPSLHLVPLRRRRLSVRWERSIVNPQNMSYCLAISSTRPFGKLCEAEAALATRNATNDIRVQCVKQKTQVVLNKLQKGQKYFVGLFATNIHTKLTVPFGNASTVVASRLEPIILKDGKAKSVSFRKHEGHINFRFRVAETGKDVHLYLVSCGGSVNAQLMHRRRNYEPGQRVNGYARFHVPNPKKGDYYSLKVTAPDGDQLARIQNVEALATQHRDRFPLPDLPRQPEVFEYSSLRRCTSVTVGWVPAPGEPARYCVMARRLPLYDIQDPPQAAMEQCGLNARPRRSFVTRVCGILNTDNTSVTTHNVKNLTPGTSYSVQVTVKKLNGRTLSYKSINVFTKHTCD